METPDGEGWFVHFQSAEHMVASFIWSRCDWQDDWPIIGEAQTERHTGAAGALRTDPRPPARHFAVSSRRLRMSSNEEARPAMGVES